jgi:hypothetical protein
MKRFLMAAAVCLVTLLVFAQADVAGKWTGQQQGGGGAQPVMLELKADGSKLTGTLKTGDNSAQISDGKLDGNKVSFKTTQSFGGNDVQINWTDEIKGDELTLNREFAGGGFGGDSGGRGGVTVAAVVAVVRNHSPQALEVNSGQYGGTKRAMKASLKSVVVLLFAPPRFPYKTASPTLNRLSFLIRR